MKVKEGQSPIAASTTTTTITGSVFRILQTYLTMLTVLCQSFVEK